MGMRIVFYSNPSFLGYEIYAHRYTHTGRVPYKITIEQMPEVAEWDRAAPSCQLKGYIADEVIKALVEGLIEANLMPKMGATESELKATMRHLDDLRSLVFESLRPKELK